MEVFKWEWCDNCDIICSIATVDRVHWVVSIIRTKQPRSMKPHHIINYWNHLRHITTSVTPSVYDIVWLYDPELPNRCWVNPHCSKVNYCLHLFVLSLWHSFSLPDPPHLHCVEEWKIKMVKSAWEKKKREFEISHDRCQDEWFKVQRIPIKWPQAPWSWLKYSFDWHPKMSNNIKLSPIDIM